MCGICGIVSLKGEAVARDMLTKMIDPIVHRGPDESGVQVMGACGFGHVRLSIVDLASGQQPMSTEDGRYVIVFNGEIFNHVALRERLVAKGRRFRTQCDTEVILHMYAEMGTECVREFNGQWAFAIWDRLEGSLFLSRDRLGIRPLYYTRTGEHFMFASEIKALVRNPTVSRRLNLKGLDNVLTLWSIVPPQTAFEGIYQVPPGHSLMLAGEKQTSQQYWALSYSDADTQKTEDQYADELMELLVDSTRLQFTSADVPVGAYLSGGLDSTIITSVVRSFTNAPVRTFSVAFEHPEFDESQYQRQAVDHLRLDHQQVLCRNQDIADVFNEVIWHAEQPMVRTAPAPMYLLAKLVRQHGYKVVLTGEGSDEIFGGYDIFKEAKIRRYWAQRPESRLRPLLLRRLYPYLPALQAQSDEYLRAFFHVRSDDLSNPLFSHLPRCELTRKTRLFYSREVVEQLRDYDSYGAVIADLPSEHGSWDPFCQAQFLESRYLLPGYLLSSQGDRMAMAHGVEGRYPFLDHRLVEFASRLPVRLKMRVLTEKYILKRAAGGLIPPALRTRPKQPYRAPEADGLYDVQTGRARQEYIDDVLSERKIGRAGVFNPSPVKRLVDKARSGKIVGVRDAMSLVLILSTQLLIEQFIENPGRIGNV